MSSFPVFVVLGATFFWGFRDFLGGMGFGVGLVRFGCVVAAQGYDGGGVVSRLLTRVPCPAFQRGKKPFRWW